MDHDLIGKQIECRNISEFFIIMGYLCKYGMDNNIINKLLNDITIHKLESKNSIIVNILKNDISIYNNPENLNTDITPFNEILDIVVGNIPERENYYYNECIKKYEENRDICMELLQCKQELKTLYLKDKNLESYVSRIEQQYDDLIKINKDLNNDSFFKKYIEIKSIDDFIQYVKFIKKVFPLAKWQSNENLLVNPITFKTIVKYISLKETIYLNIDYNLTITWAFDCFLDENNIYTMEYLNEFWIDDRIEPFQKFIDEINTYYEICQSKIH